MKRWILTIGAMALMVSAAGAAEKRIALKGHVPKELRNATRLERLPADEPVDLGLVVRLDQKQLDQAFDALYGKNAPSQKQYLTSAEFEQKFGVAGKRRHLKEFAQSQGLVVSNSDDTSGSLVVHVTGKAHFVEQAFNVELHHYRNAKGKRFHAHETDPEVPASVEKDLGAVAGLSDIPDLAQPLAHPAPPKNQAMPLEISNATACSGACLAPSDIKTLYGLNGVSLSGSGQSVAILALNGYDPADIVAYQNLYQLPHTPVTFVSVDGMQNLCSGLPCAGQTYNGDLSQVEVRLDIELVSAIAPGSNILVYAASGAPQTILDALNQIATENRAKSVSISYNFGNDNAGYGQSFHDTENQIFQRMGLQGQSVFAGSGDCGAWGSAPCDGAFGRQVIDPGSQPNLTSVGGTTMSGTLTLYTEMAWPGSGGGVSSIWPIPSYQVGTANAVSTQFRNVPDVSLYSDCRPGYGVYINGVVLEFCGTSAAAPLWAGMSALVNQQRTSAGNGPLGFANPTIYTLGASSNYHTAMNDILSGDNGAGIGTGYFTGPGYDNVTGWGSFKGQAMINALAGTTGGGGGGGCTNVSLQNGNVTPTSVSPGGTYTLTCTYNADPNSCVHAADQTTGLCQWLTTNGNVTTWSCTAGTTSGLSNGICSYNNSSPACTVNACSAQADNVPYTISGGGGTSAIPQVGVTYDDDLVMQAARPEGPGGSWYSMNPNNPNLPPNDGGIYRHSTPVTGLYEQHDPGILKQHAYWLTSAGFDHVLVDWTNLIASNDPRNVGDCNPATNEGGFKCYNEGTKSALGSMMQTWGSLSGITPPKILMMMRMQDVVNGFDGTNSLANEIYAYYSQNPSLFMTYNDGTVNAGKPVLLVFFNTANCAWTSTPQWSDSRFNVKFTNGYMAYQQTCGGAYVNTTMDAPNAFINDSLPYWPWVENAKLPSGEFQPVYKRHTPTLREEMSVWIGLWEGDLNWDGVSQTWGGLTTFDHEMMTVTGHVPNVLWINRFNYYISWYAQPQEGLTEDKSSSFEPTTTQGFQRIYKVTSKIYPIKQLAMTSPVKPTITLVSSGAGTATLSYAASLANLKSLGSPQEYAMSTTPTPQASDWKYIDVNNLNVQVNTSLASTYYLTLRNAFGTSQTASWSAGGGNGIIQGFRMQLGNGDLVDRSATIGQQAVVLDGVSLTPSVGQPFTITGISAGAHTFSVTPPAGWRMLYDYCVNSVNCADLDTGRPRHSGNTAALTLAANDTVDFRWYFIPPPATGPSADANTYFMMEDSRLNGVNYGYGPSIIQSNGTYHAFYCSTGGSAGQGGSWDFVREIASSDGRTWSTPTIAVKPFPLTNGWDEAACDPSVVLFKGPNDSQPYYYLFFGSAYKTGVDSTNAAVNQGFLEVARSASIDGPYLTYLQNGTWGTPSASVLAKSIIMPLVLRTNVQNYGVGQPKVVVRNNQLYMWYTDDSSTLAVQTYLLVSNDPVVWTPDGTRGIHIDSVSNDNDVKYDAVNGRFVLYRGKTDSSGKSYLDVVYSTDGMTWGSPTTVIPTTSFPNTGGSGTGVAGDASGQLSANPILIAINTPYDLNSLPLVPGGTNWGYWDLRGFFVNATGPVNQPPTVTLTSPTNGATFSAPATISLAATASDPDGTISKVEFYQGSTLLNTAFNSPYIFTWTNVPAGSYSVVAKAYDNSTGTTLSTPANITVNGVSNTPPQITAQPQPQIVTAGQTASFSVSATGTAPLNYQWYKNGSAISGATNAFYTTPVTSVSDSGSQFAVIVNNITNQPAASNPATLTVNPVQTNQPPSITTQPGNQSVNVGQTATFSVSATGTAPLSYQWYKNGSAILGATNTSYTTPAASSSDSGSQFVVIVNNITNQPTTSHPATLTINSSGSTPVCTAGSCSADGQTVSFTWTGVTGNNPHYIAEYWDNGAGFFAQVLSPTLSGSIPSTPGHSYVVEILASLDGGVTYGTPSNDCPPSPIVCPVPPPPNPSILSFTGNPLSIASGQSSTLSWTTANGVSASISPSVGTVGLNNSVSVSPSVTTTYTLTINGAAGTTPATRTVTITVTAAAPTATFSANPTTITAGQSSTLSWTMTNATSASIDNGIGPVALNSSMLVNPSVTTTYTLTVTGPGGSITKTATITVNAAAPTATFSANPTTITAGQSSTLSWTMTNATSASIDKGVGSVALNSSVSVSPAVTTTYTLTVTGPGGTITKTATITVNPAAPTATFSANPTTITAGQSSTLSWAMTNATSASIDNGIGPVALNSSMLVNPSVTTTYMLTVTGPGGSITKTATITVNSAAPTATFSANPITITAGQSSTLSWTMTNATSASIDKGVGSVALNSSVSVSPTATTIYTLTVTGPGGTITKTATITVNPAPPTATFSANPTTITAGQSSTLSWTMTNATSASIDKGIGPVALNSSVSVSPAVTTTYTLTVTGPGGTITKTATITANPAAPTATFTANPTAITVGQPSILAWTMTNATSASIDNGIGAVALNSNWIVAPSVTTTYTLTVTGPGGTITKTTTITVNQLPVASFTTNPSPAQGNDPLLINFNGSASHDSDGTIASYDWDFGDGSAHGTGATTSHTYGPGTFTATLTVTDNSGGTGSITASVHVTHLNQLPVASFTTNPSPAQGNDPLLINFNGSASHDLDGTIASYDWDFGDGSAHGTGATTSHTYGPGTFMATLTVTDNNGGTNSITAPVTVTHLNQLPVASFTTNPTPAQGNDPLLVSFNGSSSHDSDGTIVSYDWNFGDGSAHGTGATASHTYGPGTFTATLTVTDNNGGTNSSTTQVHVTHNNVLPVASFTTNPTPAQGNDPLLVSFNGSASHDSDGTIASYDWNFGDGSAHGTGATASHTYGPGTFTATLTVTDNSGGTNNTSALVNVTHLNQLPVASFTTNPTPAQGNDPLLINFNGSASHDSDGTIASYDWDFGDGSTHGTGATTSHTYGPGTFTATLTVTDNSGGTGSITAPVTVTHLNQLPVASFTTNPSPAQGNDPLLVSFNGSASHDSDGTIASYDWNFGDGSPHGTSATASHTYSPGTFTATLTVTDNSGGTNSITASVHVTHLNQLPVANFTTNPTPAQGNDPLLITFNGSASHDSDGTIASYDWDFGDGSAHGTGATASHTYGPGTFTATLTVTDNSGGKGSITAPVHVTHLNQLPVASITTNPTPAQGNDPLLISFNGSTSHDSDGTIASYDWDFGDGSAHGTGATMSHTYGPGTFTATLTVTDNSGGTNSITAPVHVTHLNQIPVASFTTNPSPAQGNDPLLINFNGSASHDSDGTIASYDWNFGDGSAHGTGATASHTYGPGTFTATLTVTDNSGGTNSITAPVHVTHNNVLPVASFTTNPTPAQGNDPLLVSFNGSASNDSDGTIASYDWDFGDGSAHGSGATASHTYGPGTFTATLIVTDNSGGTNNITAPVHVTHLNQLPVASFTTTPTPAQGNDPLLISFNGSASHDSDGTIASYDWNFGDGSAHASGVTTSHTYGSGNFTATLTVTDNSGGSNSTSVPVVVRSSSTGPAPTPPDLSSIDQGVFSSHDTLSIHYSGSVTGFTWEFDPMATVNASNQFMESSSGSRIGTPIATISPALGLAGLSLPPGRYTVRVQALSNGLTSDWATATIDIVEADLAAVKVFPNPFKAARGDDKIHFEQLPAGSTVKLYTVSGRWVKTLDGSTGKAAWDMATDSGDKAASGIYLYTISDGQDHTIHGKLAVIR